MHIIQSNQHYIIFCQKQQLGLKIIIYTHCNFYLFLLQTQLSHKVWYFGFFNINVIE